MGRNEEREDGAEGLWWKRQGAKRAEEFPNNLAIWNLENIENLEKKTLATSGQRCTAIAATGHRGRELECVECPHPVTSRPGLDRETHCKVVL